MREGPLLTLHQHQFISRQSLILGEQPLSYRMVRGFFSREVVLLNNFIVRDIIITANLKNIHLI